MEYGEAVLIISAIIQSEDQNRALILFNNHQLDNNIIEELINSGSNKNIMKIKNYYETNIPNQTDSTFKSHFRMSKTQFVFVMDQIGNSPAFQKKQQELQGGRNQICPEKALLITLWTLATPDSYRSVAERFDIAKSSIFTSMNTVIAIIIRELGPRFVKWPTNEQREEVSRRFNKYGFPQVIGAIDGCHIPIKQPTVNGRDYFNRKKFYSLVLQGICNSEMLFTDCDIRWPGSVHDGRILRTSDMYPVARELCQPHYYVIGDAAYPCKEWLMTPFRNNGHLTEAEQYYNRVLSKTRVIIENAFALLKGRFRRLKDKLYREHIGDYVNTIYACCVLHNICILKEEHDLQDFITEGRDPDHYIPMIHQGYDNDGAAGPAIRNNIVLYLWNNRNGN